MCCQVEVSATSWAFVQRSPVDCGVSLRGIQNPQNGGGLGPRWAVAPEREGGGGGESCPPSTADTLVYPEGRIKRWCLAYNLPWRYRGANGVGCLTPLPAALPPGINPVLMIWEDGCAPVPAWRGAENLGPHIHFFFWIPSLVLSLYFFRTRFFVFVLSYSFAFAAGFEPAIPASQPRQAYAIDRAATGICLDSYTGPPSP